MSFNERNKVCPAEHSGMLDVSFRKIFHNPRNILKPYIKEGMTVLDLGCGPGFFLIEIAKMVGSSGKVIAADLQEGMLQRVAEKIKNSDVRYIIELHKCREESIGLSQRVDFILLFWVLHEMPDQSLLLKELKTLLNPGGRILIVEPKLHVSRSEFNDSVAGIKNNGFNIVEEPKVLMSRSVLISIAPE